MLVIIKKSIKMENNNGLFKSIVIMILLALLICAGICTYQYVNTSKENVVVYEEEPCALTLEEAMNEFRIVKEISNAEEIYYNLPESIVEALFKQCGTMASITDYVDEYNRNKSYYISLQISKQLEKIGLIEEGIDNDKIKEVTVKTKLKKETCENIPPLNVKPDTTKQ